MIKKMCIAVAACLGSVALAAEPSQTLNRGNLVAAIDASENQGLIDGGYERVIFYLAGGDVVTLPGESFGAIVGILSYPIKYANEAQRCKLNSSSTAVSGATTTVYWCEPATSKLQSDVYQLTVTGTAPQYVVSFAEVDCTSEKPSIPPVVWNRFC